DAQGQRSRRCVVRQIQDRHGVGRAEGEVELFQGAADALGRSLDGFAPGGAPLAEDALGPLGGERSLDHVLRHDVPPCASAGRQPRAVGGRWQGAPFTAAAPSRHRSTDAARRYGGDMASGGVLVTGASSGIGRACALHLDGLGHRVFAGVRSETAAESLRRAASDRLVAVVLDVTDTQAIDSAAGSIASTLDGRGLVGLVNNAGLAPRGPLEYLPIAEWRTQLEVNVVGQVAVTKA